MKIQVMVLLMCLLAFQPARGEPTALFNSAKEIQRDIEALRGQKISGQLKMGVVSKKDILKFLEQRIAEEYSSEEFRRAELQLKLLRLIPWDFDYRTELKAIYVDQIGGFYDHKKQELFIADWLPGFSQKPVLAHEIFHAVQVQEWDTAKLLDSKTLPTDRLLAHQALLEGDATIVMMQYMLGGLNQNEEMLSTTLEQTKYGMLRQLGMSAKLAVFTGGSANFANAPRYVKRSLVMPYVMGAEFIWSLRRDAKMPWSKINDIYKKPPSTTENILLPETFWKQRESAMVPPALPKRPVTWRQTDDDVFGLFMMSEAIERNKPHDKPPLAVSGWGGDTLTLFEKGTQAALVLNSIWDNSAHAQSFAKLWRESYQTVDGIEIVTKGQTVIIVIAKTAKDARSLKTELGLTQLK